MYLEDNYDFGDRLNLGNVHEAVMEVRAIIKEFKHPEWPTLDEFSDLCLFFLKKAKDRKFVRYSKLKSYDFYFFLEEALSCDSHQFKQYMLYLKKNQQFIITEDFIKILVKFKVLSLPFGRDLDLNPTSSTIIP